MLKSIIQRVQLLFEMIDVCEKIVLMQSDIQ